MKNLAFLLLSLCMLGSAVAGEKATAPTTNTVSVTVTAVGLSTVLTWVAPTLNTDGTAIAAPITYNVYAGYNTAPTTKIATGLITATYTDSSTSLLDGMTATYAVTAVVGGVESAQSATASKTFPAGVPNAPTGVVAK